MAKKRSVGGIIVTVILLLILAIVIGIAACAFMITATPNLERYEVADAFSFDAQALAMMMGGEVVIQPEQVNRLLQDSVEDEGGDFALSSIRVDTDDAEKELWVCVQLRALEHIWTVSLLGEVEAVVENGTIQAVSIAPQKLQIGRLPIPKFVWQPILDAVLAESGLDYAENCLTVEVPNMELPMELDGVTIRPDGLVLKVQPMLQLPSGGNESVGTTPMPDDEKQQEIFDKAQDVLQEVQGDLMSGDISMEEVVDKLQEEIGKEDFNQVIDQLLPEGTDPEELIDQIPDEVLQTVPGLKEQLGDWLEILQNAKDAQ